MCDLLIEHAADQTVLAANPVVQAAAQRWIEVLGEAASHVSDHIRSKRPEVRWRDIIGIRTILAHAYFHVDQDIVGSIVTAHVAQLRALSCKRSSTARPSDPTPSNPLDPKRRNAHNACSAARVIA